MEVFLYFMEAEFLVEGVNLLRFGIDDDSISVRLLFELRVAPKIECREIEE